MNNETLIKLIKNSKILDITFNVLKDYEGWSVETKSTGNQHRTTLSRGINKIYIIWECRETNVELEDRVKLIDDCSRDNKIIFGLTE
ncbi:MAG: hypothetical protein OSJ76_01210 [Alphaproteobacteria bacterium]|nr:hypothetical protein [Alphaproteobacteria bacterium]